MSGHVRRGVINTSAVAGAGIVGMGSFAAAADDRRGRKLAWGFEALLDGLPRYEPAIRRAGDVFFHISRTSVGHSNMTSSDLARKVDSVDPGGVRIIPISRDRNMAIVLRFSDRAIALRAALLAMDWANAVEATEGPAERVGYSQNAVGWGVTGRVMGAMLGSSKFGSGARARLQKYANRFSRRPRNVICSEMIILAYQLCMTEHDPGFIKLDAKHTLPGKLLEYMLRGAGKSHWTPVAYRDGDAETVELITTDDADAFFDSDVVALEGDEPYEVNLA